MDPSKSDGDDPPAPEGGRPSFAASGSANQDDDASSTSSGSSKGSAWFEQAYIKASQHNDQRVNRAAITKLFNEASQYLQIECSKDYKLSKRSYIKLAHQGLRNRDRAVLKVIYSACGMLLLRCL